MMWVFVLPSLYIYWIYRHDFIIRAKNGGSGELNFSAKNANLGVLAGSSSFCIQQYYGINENRTLRCNYGTPEIVKLLQLGLIPDISSENLSNSDQHKEQSFCADWTKLPSDSKIF